MTTGDYQNLSADDLAEEADIVVVSEAETSKRGGPAIFPLLLGVLILILDIYLLVQIPTYFFAKHLQAAISLALMFTSIIIGIFLIAYAFGHTQFTSADGHRRQISPFTAAVGLPLVLGAVAIGATVGGMGWNQATAERQQSVSCVDYIERAQNIAKDNPKFRMPAGDRDELRCRINASLGR